MFSSCVFILSSLSQLARIGEVSLLLIKGGGRGEDGGIGRGGGMLRDGRKTIRAARSPGKREGDCPANGGGVDL